MQNQKREKGKASTLQSTLRGKKKTIKVSAVKTSKSHEGFKQSTWLGSIPTRLDIEATSLDKVKFTDLSPNPNKFTFKKVAFLNGWLEFYMYPLSDLSSVYSIFAQSLNAKTSIMHLDVRRTKEIESAQRGIRYFLSLSVKQKENYLRLRGYSANINIRGRTNA